MTHLSALEVSISSRALSVFITVTDDVLSSKLLEAIGAITKDEKKEAAAERNFQEAVTTPTDRAVDEQAAALGDPPETSAELEADRVRENSGSVLSAIGKVTHTTLHFFLVIAKLTMCQLRKIVRAVRSSPQRQSAWLDEIRLSLRRTEAALDEAERAVNAGETKKALMLILDVKTRWSSTHQMLST